MDGELVAGQAHEVGWQEGALEQQGVGKLFGPGTSTVDLVAFIKDWFAAKERQSQEA